MNNQATAREKQFAHMYKHLADVDPKIVAHEERLAKSSPYREKFHIEPHSGVLNDPNGFAYFNGEYHLFYQWTPLAFTENPNIWHHGWYHLASKDLVHWQDLGHGIESDTDYDKHGTYSGSGLVVGDKLFLMYTGNTWNQRWQRIPYQLGAYMDTDGVITKDKEPLISGIPTGYTPHFRDPKLWVKNGVYYAVMGIQRKNLTGASIVYKSTDLHHWSQLGEIQTSELDFGYMWECPEYFELDGKGVLLFSPQGLEPQGNMYQNVYQTGAFIGKTLELPNLEFSHRDFQELDAGFDFYATQTAKAPDGRRILSAWMGVPEVHYPTEDFHYNGVLVLPRELSIRDGHLCQRPVRELWSLRHAERKLDAVLSESNSLSIENVQELKLSVDMTDANQVVLDLSANVNNTKHTRLIIDKDRQEVVLDRTVSGVPLAEKNGNVRRRQLKIGAAVSLDILIDTSSVEIFINDGWLVFTARIFPDVNQQQNYITVSKGKTKIQGKSWLL